MIIYYQSSLLDNRQFLYSDYSIFPYIDMKLSTSASTIIKGTVSFIKKIRYFVYSLFAINLLLCSLLLVNVPKLFSQPIIPDSLLNISFNASSNIEEFEYVQVYSDKTKVFDTILYFTKTPVYFNLVVPVKDNFENVKVKITGLTPAVSFSDLKIGNVSLTPTNGIYSDDPNCIFSKDSVDAFTITKTDKSSTDFNFSVNHAKLNNNGIFSLQKIETPFYLRVIYFFSALCQKHANGLLLSLLISLLLINVGFSRKSFTVITNITVAYFIVMIHVLWIDAEDVLHTFFSGDKFEVLYKIIKTQFLPLSVLISMSFVLSFINNKIAKLLVIGISLLTISAITADIFAYTEFKVHLVISDIFNYSKNVGDSGKIISDFVFNKKTVFLTTVLLIISVIYSYVFFYKSPKARWKGAIFLTTLFVCIYLLPAASKAGNEAVFTNIFVSGNASKNANKRYTGTFDYHEPVIKIKGQKQKKNVILLVVESLSSYQSAFFSGINKNTPHIDELAKQGIAFTNYYSNGFHTDTGNFAILTSIPSLNGSLSSMTDPVFFKDSFIHNFVNAGYSTYAVYSTNDIGQDNTMKKISGISTAYTGKDPFYKDCERLSFDSVPDEDMFNKVMSVLPEWTDKGPFFTHIMTTTTHGPYIVPKTHEFSYENTIRYVDEAIYKFYNNLKAANFFENGMLIITSDHRAMLPFTSLEQRKLGRSGISKIPLIILGSGLENKIYTEQASHNSIGAILEYLNLDSASFYEFNSIPFLFREEKEKQKNGFIIFQYHEPQDTLLVIAPDGKDYQIKLEGDKTSFIDSCDSEQFTKHVLNTIRWVRTIK